jgi:hypothetical protein
MGEWEEWETMLDEWKVALERVWRVIRLLALKEQEEQQVDWWWYDDGDEWVVNGGRHQVAT